MHVAGTGASKPIPSCAEYESPDIAEYLRLVNNVPDKYSINKLCTEDPVSVSRQFSHKFHAFFNTFIVKGEVLGPVEHFYWKKEYQARGAPCGPIYRKLSKPRLVNHKMFDPAKSENQCDLLNEEMLGKLQSQVHVIPCIDDVDETRSTAKWHQKAAKQLEKMNNDCNNTAGLEAVLKLALGARVMLRRNIDVKAGLVNGAIGTILGVFPERVSIKFDHLDSACDIEK